MNSIEKDFRSEMSQIETERLDEELPKILAGKMERFEKWKAINTFTDRISRTEVRYITSDIDSPAVWRTYDDLYDYWLAEVDGK